MRSIITLTTISIVTLVSTFAASATPNNAGPNCSDAGRTFAACVIEQSQLGGG